MHLTAKIKVWKDIKSGFTLIELSIVLVIIGLVIGGIIVGKDMIGNAKTRAQISQIEAITTSTRAFKLKYGCLPGDCRNAVQRGLGQDTSLHNGNGDDRVNYPCSATSHHQWNDRNKEADNFFYHLSLAGMVEGSFAPYAGIWGPSSPYTVEEYASHFPQGKAPAFNVLHIMPTYLAGPSTPNNICGQGNASMRSEGNSLILQYRESINGQLRGGVDIVSARNMDTKLDDGKPFTGNVGVASGGGGITYNHMLGAPHSLSCATADNEYSATNPTSSGFRGCRVVFANRF